MPTRRSVLARSATTGLLPGNTVRAQPAADTRPWWFVLLESGRKTPDDKAALQAMQMGHIQNFKRLHAEKKLFAAGPLRGPSGLKRGIVVVRAELPPVLAGCFQADDYVRGATWR